MRSSWTVVLPTNRPEQAEKWFEAWKPLFKEHNAHVIILWDLEKVPKTILNKETMVDQYCWTDVDAEFGEDSWIFPRRTCDIRSYGMYKAWQHGNEYILALDDDVTPYMSDPFDEYERVFKNGMPSHGTFHVGSLLEHEEYVRGFPQKDKEIRPVIIQFGGWNGVPDLDGYTQIGYKHAFNLFDPLIVNIPRGVAMTGCSMNVALHRDAVVWWYQLLMGPDHPYDRFGDIWSGLFLKKLCDSKRLPVVINGKASVLHTRASDPVINMRKEASGIPGNEYLWDWLGEFDLNKGDSFMNDYKKLAQFVKEKQLFPSKEYSDELSEAMTVWANLFKEE